MRSDVLVLGAELEGLVAALRLLDQGHGVRVLAAGGGSLHYAPDGLHVLGYVPDNSAQPVAGPFAAIGLLDRRHPLRLLGEEAVRGSLDWFLERTGGLGLAFRSDGANVWAVSLAGQPVPVYALGRHQATLAGLEGESAALVAFHGQRDFPAGLGLAELRRRGIDARLVRVEAPGGAADNAGIARSLDALAAPESFFQDVRRRLPEGSRHALFPAVLGLDRHAEIVAAAERVLEMPCREVPTLPPSVPGLRLDRALMAALRRKGALVHLGARAVAAVAANGRCEAVLDDGGRRFEAAAFVVATGGVLMGGLEVDSRGVAREPLFGLKVTQTQPLSARRVDRALDALHLSGVETDRCLRPLADGHAVFGNVFVTGRTLAHWNPPREHSTEGVAITTGWAAAGEAARLLEG